VAFDGEDLFARQVTAYVQGDLLFVSAAVHD